MVHLPFHTRKDAGVRLASLLQTYKGNRDTLILALVRGGVAIGHALATELSLPLFPYVVRKLGHPGHREYGLGAIAEGGSTHLDEPMMKMQGLTWVDLEPIAEEEMAEMKRRVQAYTTVAPRPDLKGKTIILTDDGAATGGTMLAAIEDMRRSHVKKVIVALPVSPPDTKELLARKADEIAILATPEPFNAVGQWYRDFPQLEDDEVLRLLRSVPKA